MSETQISDVSHLSVPELADSALYIESLLERTLPESSFAQSLVDRRKVYLDELVARGALTHYSFA
jgi:hypothetical protein